MFVYLDFMVNFRYRYDFSWLLVLIKNFCKKNSSEAVCVCVHIYACVYSMIASCC